MTFSRAPIPHPDYGSRVFRRRIRLEHRDGAVIAGLEDNLHACRLWSIGPGAASDVFNKQVWAKYPGC